MTRKDAIQHLENLKISYPFADVSEWVDMAIEALHREEAEEKGYCHRIKPKEYFSADVEPKCIAQIKVDTEEIVRRIKEEYDITDGWIPCSERLPEEGERVLATHLGGVNPNRQVIEHIYQCGEFTCGWDMDMNVGSPTFGQRYMGKVIAWMPLPEPYREDGEA